MNTEGSQHVGSKRKLSGLETYAEIGAHLSTTKFRTPHRGTPAWGKAKIGGGNGGARSTLSLVLSPVGRRLYWCEPVHIYARSEAERSFVDMMYADLGFW